MASAVIGTNAYFGGGSYSGYISTIEVFDSTSGNWSIFSKSLSLGRAQLVAAAVGSKLIFFSGISTLGHSKVVDIIDVLTLSTSIANATAGRLYPAYGVIYQRLAIFALGSQNTGPSNIVDYYNSTSNTWSNSTLSISRQYPTGLAYGSNFYCFGGTNSQNVGYNITDIYNIDTNSWSTMSFKFGRGYATSTNIGPLLIIAGGYSSGYLSSAEIFDSFSNTWSNSTISAARIYLSATSLGCKAFFAGGNGLNGVSSIVDVYDASTKSWAIMNSLGYSSYFLSAVTVGQVAIFAGGSGGINNLAVNYISLYCSTGMYPIKGICSCPYGSFYNGTGCSNCTAGSYSSTILVSSCLNCTAGSYSQSGASVCKLCSLGTFSSINGVGNCTICAAGTFSIYSGSNNSSLCLSCPSNALIKSSVSSALSSPRRQLGVASVSDKAYFGGGYGDSTFYNTIDVYDYSTGSWSTLSTVLSVARAAIITTALSSKIIFFCGYVASSVPSAVIDIIDINSNILTSTNSITARYLSSSFTINDQIAMFGLGILGNNAVTGNVDIYNFTSGVWSTYLLSARQASGGISYGQVGYFVGGLFTGLSSSTNLIDVYNHATKTWSYLFDLTPSRGYLSSASIGQILLFAGGYTGSSSTAVVNLYDTVSGIWTTGALSVARLSPAAATINCKAFFAGGNIYGVTTYVNVIDIYDSSSNSWSVYSSTLPNNAWGISGVVLGSTALFVGGETSSTSWSNSATYISICASGIF